MENYNAQRTENARKEISKPRNCVAAVVGLLAEEVRTVIKDGHHFSDRLHAPASGWEGEFHKGWDERATAFSRAREMEAITRSGFVPLRINTKRLAKKIGYAENNIYPVLKLLVKTGILEPMGSLYVVGHHNGEEEIFCPILEVQRELCGLKDPEKKNRHFRLFIELNFLLIELKLIRAIGKKPSFHPINIAHQVHCSLLFVLGLQDCTVPPKTR